MMMRFSKKARNWLLGIGTLVVLTLIAYRVLRATNGYYGISLGGIIGVIFCGVDERVKVPVIVLAGGQINLLYEEQALSEEAKDFVSIIEPLNFVKKIYPRPLLMLNAENDEIVPPKNLKKSYGMLPSISNIPLDKVYQDGLNWFNTHL